MILASAEGLTNRAVAERVGASPQAVGKWRRRFLERGVQGLHDELRPGRPRSYDDEKVAGVINRALQEKPERKLERAPHQKPRASPRPPCSAGSRSLASRDVHCPPTPSLSRRSGTSWDS